MESVEEPSRKRARDDSGDSDSADAKRFRDDLLVFLDDSYQDPADRDLDSVIRSLEEEISPAKAVDLATDSGESQPQLGYLLGASDDELGLPPPSSSSSGEVPAGGDGELAQVSGESLWGFDEEFPSYESFEFGTGDNYTGRDEYVALDGLFEYSDVCFESTEWRHETLPSL